MEYFAWALLAIVPLPITLWAQLTTVIPCCSVPVSNVPASERQDWCDAQTGTCVELCRGQGNIAANGNTCDSSTLDYTCKCLNGTDISTSMSRYQQTVPAQMCYFWYDACINATIASESDGKGNAAQQLACTQARDTQCGNLTISKDSTFPASRSLAVTAFASSAAGSARSSATIVRSMIELQPSDIISSSQSPASASRNLALSKGAVAGIVIGAVAGIGIVVAILVLCRRRRRKSAIAAEQAVLFDPADYNGKQIATSSISDFPPKPELHSDGTVAEMPHHQVPLELENAHGLHEIDGGRVQSRIGQSQSPNLPEVYVAPPTAAPVQTSAENQLHEVPKANIASEPQQLASSVNIANLEAEERRIGAEMEEARRMKELRDQKYAVQQRLKEARGAGPFEM